MPTDFLALEPKARLLQDQTIRELIPTADAALELFEAETIRWADQLDPEGAIASLRRDIERQTDPAKIAELQKEIGGIDLAKDEAKRTARKLCFKAYEPARAAIKELLDRADTVVNGLLAEARESERAFFARFGFPPSATPVSDRVKALQADVKHLRNALLPMPGLPPCKSAVVEFLRCKEIF